VEVGSHVVAIGGIRSARIEPPVPLNEASDRSEVRVLDPAAEAEIIRRIDVAKQAGDTLGGEVEVVARGVVVGLGSHVSWDRKLDGRLAGMLMSIPAVKGVEIGMGFEASRRPGSEVHDAIEGGEAGRRGSGEGRGAQRTPDPRGGFRRKSNNAGGLEGGITTGEPVVVKVAMKPIATLMSPLPTVDLASGQPAKAVSERSDVTAVPAMGVIAEAVIALVLADAMLEKFGGDSLSEMRRNYEGYVAALGSRWAALRRATEG
jgi:chorismate synthase